MSYQYLISSPCKVNLSLNVHNKRDDGFHNLTSIFQLISLKDKIMATINNKGRITIKGYFDSL